MFRGKCSSNALMKTHYRCLTAIYNKQTKTYRHLIRINGKTDIHTHTIRKIYIITKITNV